MVLLKYVFMLKIVLTKKTFIKVFGSYMFQALPRPCLYSNVGVVNFLHLSLWML